MTGKHRNWHQAWRRDGAGLLHDSGLRLTITPADDGALELETDDASLATWMAHEQARGVPVHDLQARLQRLLREAAEWQQRNP